MILVPQFLEMVAIWLAGMIAGREGVRLQIQLWSCDQLRDAGHSVVVNIKFKLFVAVVEQLLDCESEREGLCFVFSPSHNHLEVVN